MSTNIKKNRKPGRPKKIIENKNLPKLGIVKNIEDNEIFMELLYDNPQIFKKIIHFFKALSSDSLHFIFLPTKCHIWAYDHFKKNKVYITIECSNINKYFLHEKMEIAILRKKLKLILSKVDKTYNCILLLSKKDSNNTHLYVVLKNDMEIDEEHRIELVAYPNNVPSFSDFLYTNPQITFDLPGRYFKKMISDITSFSDEIAIVLYNNDDLLKFQYADKKDKIKSLNVVKNKKIINLCSKINGNDMFRIVFKVDYVKPISSSFLTETVNIHLKENNPMLFKINMDNNIFDIKILTEIVDNRNYN